MTRHTSGILSAASPQFIPYRLHEGMPYFMTIFTNRFQISWVISSTFAEFERMMAMSVHILNGFIAILADAFVSLIDVLFELNPIIRLWSPMPREEYSNYFWYCKIISHTLSNLFLTYLRSTRRTASRPNITRPTRSWPYHNIFHALSHPAKPEPTLSHSVQTQPIPPRPCLKIFNTISYRTRSHRAQPLRNSPDSTRPKPHIYPYPTGFYLNAPELNMKAPDTAGTRLNPTTLHCAIPLPQRSIYEPQN